MDATNQMHILSILLWQKLELSCDKCFMDFCFSIGCTSQDIVECLFQQKAHGPPWLNLHNDLAANIITHQLWQTVEAHFFCQQQTKPKALEICFKGLRRTKRSGLR